MSVNIAPRIMEVNVGETINETVDISGLLKGSEVASGTPAVVEQNTSHLTIANVAVNTVQQTVEGKTVAIGAGIDYTVSGFQSGVKYTLIVTFSTDASPNATRVCYVRYKACG